MVRTVLTGVYFAFAALVWCWDGAYNVLQGDQPQYGFSAILVVLGLFPPAAGALYYRQMRRNGRSVASTLTFTAAVPLGVSLVVLIVRAGFAMGF